MLHKKENKLSKIVAFPQAFFYLCNNFFTCTLTGTYFWTTIAEQQCSKELKLSELKQLFSPPVSYHTGGLGETFKLSTLVIVCVRLLVLEYQVTKNHRRGCGIHSACYRQKGIYSLKPSSWSSHGSQSSNSREMRLCSLKEIVSKVE